MVISVLSKELEAGKQTLIGLADNPAQLSVQTQVIDFSVQTQVIDFLRCHCHCFLFMSSSSARNQKICIKAAYFDPPKSSDCIGLTGENS